MIYNFTFSKRLYKRITMIKSCKITSIIARIIRLARLSKLNITVSSIDFSMLIRVKDAGFSLSISDKNLSENILDFDTKRYINISANIAKEINEYKACLLKFVISFTKLIKVRESNQWINIHHILFSFFYL